MILARVVLPTPGGPQKIMEVGVVVLDGEAEEVCRGRAGDPGRYTRRGSGGACVRRAAILPGRMLCSAEARASGRGVEEAHEAVPGGALRGTDAGALRLRLRRAGWSRRRRR